MQISFFYTIIGLILRIILSKKTRSLYLVNLRFMNQVGGRDQINPFLGSKRLLRLFLMIVWCWFIFFQHPSSFDWNHLLESLSTKIAQIITHLSVLRMKVWAEGRGFLFDCERTQFHSYFPSNWARRLKLAKYIRRFRRCNFSGFWIFTPMRVIVAPKKVFFCALD